MSDRESVNIAENEGDQNQIIQSGRSLRGFILGSQNRAGQVGEGHTNETYGDSNSTFQQGYYHYFLTIMNWTWTAQFGRSETSLADRPNGEVIQGPRPSWFNWEGFLNWFRSVFGAGNTL